MERLSIWMLKTEEVAFGFGSGLFLLPLHYRKNPLKEPEQGAILIHMDITNEWTKKDKKGFVVEKLSYIVGGINYIVDGKHVILKPSEQERRIAAILSEKYGKDVELVPKVDYPPNIQTPDYLIDGERFDLKSPTGKSKNLLYNLVSKKRKQSSSFIFDITDCSLSDDDIERQVKELYFSRHTRFIDKIVIMKNGEVLKVYKRQ